MRVQAFISLALNELNLPSAYLGYAHLHMTSFWLQEGFLHCNAGFGPPDISCEACVQTWVVGPGTTNNMAEANHWSLDLYCHLIDECKAVRLP